MKTGLALTERMSHFAPGPEGFQRKKPSYLRTVRKLPWPDQLALMFATLLGLAVTLVLSPVLLPLWSLAVIKKLAKPGQVARPELPTEAAASRK